MNLRALKRLRGKLANDLPVYGLWVTLESASITEMAVAMGLDWVVIDAEHGHLDWRDIVEHIRGAVRSDTVVLVRIAELNASLAKRALDIGADGIVVPNIETVQQLQDAVSFIHYPPRGVRGVGAERATQWGQRLSEHVEEAEQNLLVVPIIESVRGGEAARQLAMVTGVELFYFGPADYSATAGYPGQWEGPGVAEQILAAKDAFRAAGKHCGVIATDRDNLQLRLNQDFRMIGIGMDASLLMRSMTSMLPHGSATGGPPPEHFRPDRPEVMIQRGAGREIPLDPGVTFECHVGVHNQARNLTTGMVTVAPHAALAYHRHTFTESITLLSGAMGIEVEGRMYRLAPMDNVVIPPGVAHQTRNASADTPALLHIAMGTDQPDRDLVDQFFSKRGMPDDSAGVEGKERINRFATAPRYELEPNTLFIDYFNETLMPGIEMSGGHGLFQHGGRLPAHFHDFDESICITAGEATCIVEGERYIMSNCATALQPRGRIHYFKNETNEPMEMLWVYAGPRPERIVVDDRYCTREGNPWR